MTRDRNTTLASAANRWRQRCLLADGSVFSNELLWTVENVRQLMRYFVENLDVGEGNFQSKLRAQLAPAAPGAKKLAAEMLWVMYLIVHESFMRPETKRLQVETVWGWSGEPGPDDSDMLDQTMSAGVANPGTAYNTHRWRELVFFIRLMERWKQVPEERKGDLLDDGFAFAEWIDGQEEARGRQLRHALLFLLFPDHFDGIVSDRHKRAIVERWYVEAGGTLDDLDLTNRLAVDRALDQVRRHLEAQDPAFDFYRDPWLTAWCGTTAESGSETPEDIDKPAADAWARETFGGARVWVMAAGEGARLWPEFQREGLIGIGFGWTNDLTEYRTKEELASAMAEARGVENPSNDALASWQFTHEMEIGDHIIVKEGRSRLLGWGVVKSGSRYDPNRSEYRNVRDVEWRVMGRWDLPEGQRVPLKTLTEYTSKTQWLHMAIGLMRGVAPPPHQRESSDGVGYSLERATEDLFMSPDRFSRIVDLLGRKMNLIIQGPPGTGKSFIARRIAYRLMDEADTERVQMVQFHQAYAYEDFVQGYRPTDDGGFQVKNGVFYEFCRRAAANPDRKYVFIIDEINRGNLPRIMGELMLLIEADKRTATYAMPLTYSANDDEPFHVPDNLYLLGMMNTADRSLAMVDYALRRRFAFVTLEPEFQSDAFTEHLLRAGVPRDLVGKIQERMTRLNEAIADDRRNLGRGFEVGHSYFVPADQDTSLDEEWYQTVIRSEIEPLLREYWFDQPERVDEHVQQLLS